MSDATNQPTDMPAGECNPQDPVSEQSIEIQVEMINLQRQL